jgi:ABC-type nitrate/sulfonate/bicarbonate transport system ATPase subunit
MTTNTSLTVENLVKHYPGAEVGANAVDGVTFEIQEGQFYTLLGPSGCGKTTTLRCVAGLEKSDAGTITLDDRVVSRHAPKKFVRPDERDIGMVFQSYAIWPHMTVFENVAFPLRSVSEAKRKMRRSEIPGRVMEALETVQLGALAQRPATKLSGGKQQRLALARALVRQPKLLLLDEPLSNLDASLRELMRTELRRLQRQVGITTLYVTHDQSEALSMSNRVAVMENGRIVQEGRPGRRRRGHLPDDDPRAGRGVVVDPAGERAFARGAPARQHAERLPGAGRVRAVPGGVRGVPRHGGPAVADQSSAPRRGAEAGTGDLRGVPHPPLHRRLGRARDDAGQSFARGRRGRGHRVPPAGVGVRRGAGVNRPGGRTVCGRDGRSS